METRRMKEIETVRTTELRLTAEDVIAALRRGNGKLFKDAEVTVAIGHAGVVEPFTIDNELIVTVRQTVKRQAK